jgi:hypothetical protein
MSSPGSTRDGAGRAKARDVEEPHEGTSLPCDRAPESRQDLVWPPPDEDLDTLDYPAIGKLPDVPDPRQSALAPVIPQATGQIAPHVVTEDRSWSLVARATMWGALAAAAALVGGGIAWFTPPAAPPTVFSSPSSVEPRASRPAARAERQRPAITRPSGTADRAAATRDMAPAARSLPSTRASDDTRITAGAAAEAPATDAAAEDLPVASTATIEAPSKVAPAVPSAAEGTVGQSLRVVPFADLRPGAVLDLSAASASIARERTAIQQVLDQYQHAFDNLDVGAASAVWPTLDTAALERAFAGIREQNLSFDRCDVELSMRVATAVCPGWVTFVRRVGSARPEVRRVSWTFALERASDRWQIAKVVAR